MHYRIGILIGLLLAGLVVTAQEKGGLTYKIAHVNNSQWCNPKEVGRTQKDIEQISRCGFNVVIIGSYKFMPMHFVDYNGSPYPEARQMNPATVSRNVTTLRENIRYAHKRGIKVVSASYQHYAPYQFWKAHQAELNPAGLFDKLNEKAHQNNIYQEAVAGKADGTVPHQQWNNTCFRDFWIWSTREMLKVLPELDGFLNCYAESAWTYDLEKVRHFKDEKECRDRNATNRDFIDYMNTLYDVLTEAKGKDQFLIGIRDWYMEMPLLLKTRIPASQLLVSVKYSGYDQPLVNYPVWAKDLVDLGFRVILDCHVYDAEHPHPLYWYDAATDWKMFSNIAGGGFAGIAYQDFQSKSKGDEYNPIRLLTQQTVGSDIAGREFTNRDAIAFLKKYYGAGTEALLQSLHYVTKTQEDNIKLTPAWFWKGDGLTPGGLTDGRYWKYRDCPEAPAGMDFVRQEVVGLPEYCAEVIKGNEALRQAEARWNAEGRRSPVEVLLDMNRNADLALECAKEAMLKCDVKGSNVKEIYASAVIHRVLVTRDLAFIRSAMDYFVSGGQFDGKYYKETALLSTGIDRRAECVKQLQEMISCDLIMRELCRRYAPRRPEMRSAKEYGFARHIARICGEEIPVPPLDRERLLRLVDLIENVTM